MESPSQTYQEMEEIYIQNGRSMFSANDRQQDCGKRMKMVLCYVQNASISCVKAKI